MPNRSRVEFFTVCACEIVINGRGIAQEERTLRVPRMQTERLDRQLAHTPIVEYFDVNGKGQSSNNSTNEVGNVVRLSRLVRGGGLRHHVVDQVKLLGAGEASPDVEETEVLRALDELADLRAARRYRAAK